MLVCHRQRLRPGWPLPCFLSLRALFSEEAQQLSGSIGSQGISERTSSTPSRPDMARLVNKPLLYNGMTASIVVHRARVGSSTGHLSPFHFRALCRSAPLMARWPQPLVEQVISVDRGDSRIALAMEHDQRDSRSRLSRRPASASSHRRKAGAYIMRGTVSKAGMHTNGSIKVGICRGHGHGHGSSSRHPGHIDPVAIDVVRVHDLPRDPGDERWLAHTALLIGGLKPVPALCVVGRRDLLRVHYKECLSFGEHIHARASGKINSVLSTTMQHHYQGNCLPCVASGDVELVGASSSRIPIGSIDELPSRMG